MIFLTGCITTKTTQIDPSLPTINELKTIRDDNFNDEDIIAKLKSVATNNKNHWLNYTTIDKLKGLI